MYFIIFDIFYLIKRVLKNLVLLNLTKFEGNLMNKMVKNKQCANLK